MRGFAFAILTIAALPSNAQSQTESSSEDSHKLEEIVVTAQKRAENLQDVPLAISAFNAENLTDFGVDNLQTVQNVTPGLVFNNSSAFAQPFLRGVGTRVSSTGLESSIATYVDDRYVARPTASILDLVDVDRVEVLKGPQGTLFGRNAAGGAIRVITKDVADEFEGSVSAGAGNHGAWNVSGVVNLPVNDNVGARFAAITKQRDGYVDNLSPLGLPEWDDRDFQAYRGKLKWKMGDRITSRLTLNYWERNDTNGVETIYVGPPGYSVGIARGGVTGTHRDEVATTIDRKSKGDEFSTELRFDVGFDALDFVSISTYAKLDSEFVVDGDATSARVLDVVVFDTEDSYSQEFQFLSNTQGAWRWLAGAYFYTSDGSFDSTLDVGLPVLVSAGKQSVDTTAYAAFGQAAVDLSERWSLTVGGRWSSEKKEVDLTASTRAQVAAALVPFSADKKWEEFTPNLTLQYELNTALFYATYARGFKSGGFNYPASTQRRILDPEILDMYELGLKSDLLDDRLRLNASLYFYDYADLQITRAVSAGGTLSTENAADSEVKGLDVDMAWQATSQLSVMAGLSILDGEYKNYADATGTLPNVAPPGFRNVVHDASGKSMIRSPDWSAFLSLAYEPHVGSANVPMSLTYSYKDDYNFDFVLDPAVSALRQDAYGLLNARVGYERSGSSWKIALWANNLTDEKYFDDIVPGATGIRASYGAPRTYGVEVTFEF